MDSLIHWELPDYAVFGEVGFIYLYKVKLLQLIYKRLTTLFFTFGILLLEILSVANIIIFAFWFILTVLGASGFALVGFGGQYLVGAYQN